MSFPELDNPIIIFVRNVQIPVMLVTTSPAQIHLGHRIFLKPHWDQGSSNAASGKIGKHRQVLARCLSFLFLLARPKSA